MSPAPTLPAPGTARHGAAGVAGPQASTSHGRACPASDVALSGWLRLARPSTPTAGGQARSRRSGSTGRPPGVLRALIVPAAFWKSRVRPTVCAACIGSSAKCDFQGDGGAGEVGTGEAAGQRAERLVQLVHRLRAGQLYAGREDGVGGRGEGRQSGRPDERPATRPTGSGWVRWSWARACHRLPGRSWMGSLLGCVSYGLCGACCGLWPSEGSSIPRGGMRTSVPVPPTGPDAGQPLRVRDVPGVARGVSGRRDRGSACVVGPGCRRRSHTRARRAGAGAGCSPRPRRRCPSRRR